MTKEETINFYVAIDDVWP